MKLIARSKYLSRLLTLARLKSELRDSDSSFAGEYKFLRKLTLTLGLEAGPVLDITASEVLLLIEQRFLQFKGLYTLALTTEIE
jgi:hypothetical protein